MDPQMVPQKEQRKRIVIVHRYLNCWDSKLWGLGDCECRDHSDFLEEEMTLEEAIKYMRQRQLEGEPIYLQIELYSIRFALSGIYNKHNQYVITDEIEIYEAGGP